jgi:hypothetical protein
MMSAEVTIHSISDMICACFVVAHGGGSWDLGRRGRCELGHESFAVTERHYAGSDAVAAARVDRVAGALQ